MRNQVLLDQAALLDAARDWAAAQPATAPGVAPGEGPIIGRGHSVSGDMEAIFGGADSRAAAAPITASPAAVQVVPVGGARGARPLRGRRAALAGGGLLLAIAGSAAVTLFAFPELTPSSGTSARSDASPRTSLTTAPVRPAPAPTGEEELTPLTPLDPNYPELVIREQAGAPLGTSAAAVADPNAVVAPFAVPAPGSQTEVAAATQTAPAPVASRPVAAQAAPSDLPRANTPPRVASAPPAAAQERPASPSPRVSSPARTTVAQRSESVRAPEPRRVAAAPVSGATLMSGRIRNSDYPRAARNAGAEGTVHVQFAVQPNGRVGGCSVTRSSGHPTLDATTCRLIQRRFRYDPARDADGRAVGDTIVGRQVWWLDRDRSRRDASDAPRSGDEAGSARSGANGA